MSSETPYYVTFDSQATPVEAGTKKKKKMACDRSKKKAGSTRMYNGLRITAGASATYIYVVKKRKPAKKK
jgi:hypothetical protein